MSGSTIVVTQGTETTNINNTNWSYQNTATGKSMLTTYDSVLASGYSLTADGGPTEVVNANGATITITAHGAAGQRRIGVPAGTWTVQSGSLTWDSGLGKWLMTYNGGDPVTAVLQSGDTTGLQLHWKFDGDLTDASGNGYTGTFSGGTATYQTGKVGQALVGDGVDDKVSTTSLPTPTSTAFTVACWLNPTSLINYNQTVMAQNGWGAFVFHTTSTGAVYVGLMTVRHESH